MRFSVITPTLLRQSLLLTCKSVDEQRFDDYEHIVVVDLPETTVEQERIIQKIVSNPRRKVVRLGATLGRRVNDFGNTPRREGGKIACGEYLTYIDDDDVYINNTMRILDDEIKRLPPPGDFIIFGCHRFGSLFFNMPPGCCMTVSCQYLHKRIANGEQILWPVDDVSYISDGKFVDSLAARFTPQRISSNVPLSRVVHAGCGR